MAKTLALLSPHYPPDRGGVSDYTFHLKEFMGDCLIITKKKDQNRGPNDKVCEVTIPLRARELAHLIDQRHIGDIIIQYTPLAFNPDGYGLNYRLLGTLLYFKITRPRVRFFLFAHEARYPLQWNLKGVVLGPLHLLQFIGLLLLTRRTFFSTRRFEQEAKRYFPWARAKVSTVPIISTIVPPPTFDPHAPRANQVIYFGGHHVTQYNEMALQTMEVLHKRDPSCHFVILGLGTKPLKISPSLAQQTSQYGYLEASELSRHYQSSKLALLPLMDGCSTRRTTLMCAMAHGVPLLTNLGASSDPHIPWDNFCFVSSLDDFAGPVRSDHLTAPELVHKGQQAYAYYQAHFSAPATSKQLLAAINASQ